MSSSSLESIPEMDSIDVMLENREVSIVSVFQQCDGLNWEIIKVIADFMHETIIGHCKFTSMKHGTTVLSDAFAYAERLLVASSPNSRLSCTTVMVSGQDICMAHAGECRAIVTDQNGRVLPLTNEHGLSSALGSSSRIEVLHFQVSLFSLSTKETSSNSKRGLSRLFPKFFSSKDTVNTVEGVVLTIASSGVWDALSLDKVSKKVQKSLDTNHNNVNQAAQDLIGKESDDSSNTQSVSVIRWSLE